MNQSDSYRLSLEKCIDMEEEIDTSTPDNNKEDSKMYGNKRDE